MPDEEVAGYSKVNFEEKTSVLKKNYSGKIVFLIISTTNERNNIIFFKKYESFCISIPCNTISGIKEVSLSLVKCLLISNTSFLNI
jgi:hypothetical protein